ncbi:precorrin-6A reductase [Butyrivibrio fibrisolvens]|uniref:precorrin-6A reductase n=1 Tax=Butyrivibrio fibrisolvens TaxID=831 RepID=UPI00041B58BB|nr:precorrin-6A reductase [Butyrivibrio fibrisolvens]
MADKCKILVFGGTTEGRILTEYLVRMHIDHEVSVATEYGRDILSGIDKDNLLVGRKDEDEIRKVIADGSFNLVIDATHPFATMASSQIKSACDEQGVPYLRLQRDTGNKTSHEQDIEGKSEIVYVDDLQDAIEELNRLSGNILLLTGSKNLYEISRSISDIKRLYARVLPNEESIKKCTEAGLFGRQIIAMQGPFSKDMNIATIREVDARAILTKESGRTGGFDEKIEAAYSCGIKAIVIRNPESMEQGVSGYNMEEILAIIARKAGIDLDDTIGKTDITNNPSDNDRITLAGIGPGGADHYTMELVSALENADIVFGAEAILKNLDASFVNKLKSKGVPIVKEYSGETIYHLLNNNLNDNKHTEYTNPVVLFSGDISLCSGAKKATEVFEQNGYLVKRISGISSVTLFANKLFLSLENIRIVNAHGKKVDVRSYVEAGKETIILPSDAEDAKNICKSLEDLNVNIIAGCNLGCDDENIINICSATDKSIDNSITNMSTTDANNILNNKNNTKKSTTNNSITDINTAINSITGKTLLYVYNENADRIKHAYGIRDLDIIRGKTPMTKEEIRALSIRKLSLSDDAIVYDIGAGTGSISLEAALLSPDIKVFSIEKDDDAIVLLKQNKEKFHACNMEIIQGTAPDILDDLPVPTHVFIGGSSGNMKEILRYVFDINKDARVVINTVTAESFAEVMDALKDYPDIQPDIIQVNVTRFKKAGRYHIADALNPVYIITL